MKLYEEEIPSFAMKFSFQANMAFLIALFILCCALAWALRDHRRRLLELATEEQEDRLYLTILGILFFTCTLGSYYSFNRQSMNIDGQSVSRNAIVDEMYRSFIAFKRYVNNRADTNVPYAPDMPVQVPVPKVKDFEHYLKHHHDDASDEYTGLTIFILMLLCFFTVWYFYPRQRPDIQPPRPYMDARGTGVAVGRSASSKTKSKRAT